MKIKSFILCFILLIFGLAKSQTYPYVIPNKDYVVNVLNNSGLDAQGVASAVDYVSGAVYTCGFVNTASTGRDLVLVKFDSTGVQQWIATYDFNSLDDRARALYVDGSGNVFVTGFSEAASGNKDIVTIKYNSSGTQQWASRFNGSNNTDDEGYDILVDGSGNVWVCGYATITGKGKDYQILKYNSSGTLLSQPKRSGNANLDDIAEKMAISGTNLFVTGLVKSTTTNGDIYTLCLNTTSVTLTWSLSVNGSANSDDSGYDIRVDNGDVYVCGKIHNTTTNSDYYFARLNQTTGAVKYSNNYDGGYNGTDYATSLIPDGLGKYAITGIVANGSNTEYHTRLYDTSAVLWTHTQAVNGSYTAILPKIATDTVAQHFYVCGTYSNTTLQGLLYQLTPSGTKSWTQYHNGNTSGKDAFLDLVLDGVGRIYLPLATETSTANVYDYQLVRYSMTPAYLPCNYNMQSDTFSMSNLFYPNSGEVLDTSRNSVDNVFYYTRFTDFSQFVQQNKVSYCKYKYDTSVTTPKDTLVRVDMQFQGANEFSEIFPLDFQESLKLNYFMDFTDTFGIVNVKGAAQLIVPNIYPMIDLHYSSNSNGSKYYFVVKPTGNPSSIQLAFDGANSTSIISNDLKISTILGDFTFKKPDIYYVSVASFTNLTLTTTSVSGTNGWVSMGSDTYSINPGTYNTSWPLVVEFDMGKSATSTVTALGNLDWSTHFGNSAIDQINDVLIDNNNQLYAVGNTMSNILPNSTSTTVVQSFNYGSYDGFIAKFDNSTNPGVPVYTTFLGGNRADYLRSIDIASNGDLYVVGYSASESYSYKPKSGAWNDYYKGPIDTVNNVIHYHTDGYIAQIVPTGDTLKWNTHIGHNKHDDSFYKCKFDSNGNLFIVGSTRSSNASYFGPVNSYTRAYSNPGYTHNDNVNDGWIVKLNTSSYATWMTTIGASSTSSAYPPDDDLFDIAFAANGDVYVAGYTKGNNYVVSGGGSSPASSSYEGVISRFSNNGVINWSTHLGGTGYDIVYGITSDASNLYVTGQAQSGFPTTNGGYYYDSSHNGGADDAFLTVYNNSNTRIHSTFLGGSGLDEGRDVEIDDKGIIYVSGKTKSTNFYNPSSNNGYNLTPNGVGDWDLFISAFYPNLNDLLWTGIIGGDKGDASGFDFEVEMTIDDNQDKLYLGSMAALKNTTSYPILGSAPTYTQNCASFNDGSISRFDLTNLQSLVGIQEITKIGNEVLCYPNPTNDVVYFKFSKFNAKYDYKIYNSIGQIVLFGVLNRENDVIDLVGVKTGVYFIELYNNNERLTSKIVVSK